VSSKLVIGAGFGDEGKGLVTDWLCRSCAKPIVVRFSGGQQAGHTVVTGNVRHVFSNFGSGSLQGAPTYFSQFCSIDPVGIMNELAVLLAKGAQPLLYIDNDCPVTTPYDIARNRQHHPHGSCGLGVGDTFNREAQHFSLTFGDLFYPWVVETRLDLLRSFFYKEYADVDVEAFQSCCAAVVKSAYVRRSNGLPAGSWSDILYEGAQGLLLDQHFGFFPYVTRANTGSANAVLLHENAGGNVANASKGMEVWLVTRAYQTRHGNGPMTNEQLPHNIKANPQETNVCNPFQGQFRRSLLDLDLLAYAINRDKLLRARQNWHVVITCLDHIRNEYRFTQQGQIICCDNERDFVSRIAAVLGCSSIYLSHSADGNSISRVG